MKNVLDCKIIHDLLPSYIEKLTSDETNQAIEEHIDSCEQCSEKLRIISTEICKPQTAPKKEMKFFKKIKRTRLIATILSIVIAIILSYMIYNSEYKYINDKNAISAAINEYTAHSYFNIKDAYVLETIEVDGVLIVFYKDMSNPEAHGFARFKKGLNLRYRIVGTNYRESDYSAVVGSYPFDTKKGKYIAYGGYNIDEKIEVWGLKLFDASKSENMLRFNVKNNQFLELYKDSDIQEYMKEQQGEDKEYFFSWDIALLDSDGNDITEDYRIPGEIDSKSVGIGTAELFMLNVLIAIVLILGLIMARYFWSEE